MVLDTSALVAVLQDEPDAGALFEAILAASPPRLSAATLVERLSAHRAPAAAPPR